MSGINPVANWLQTISTGGSVQDPTTYKGAIDSNFSVATRVADNYAPHPASPNAMSVVLDPGFIDQFTNSGLQSRVEQNTQTVTISTAPTTPNNRYDLVVVDAGTGAASVIVGTPATSPAVPAIVAGKRPVAIVYVPNGTTSIGAGSITDVRAVWGPFVPGLPWAIAGGAADVITATYTPANQTLYDGLTLSFRATAANATATPTFNADGLGGKTIVRVAGAVNLSIGDIQGAGAECIVRYNATNIQWVLLNPAGSSVKSVFTRTGAVTATTGDYTVSQVTGAAPLASPTLTGVPVAPTATLGTNTTQLATTAFVQTALSGAVSTTYGAVGTYTTQVYTNNTGAANGYTPGSTYSLGSPAGTWRHMGGDLSGTSPGNPCCGIPQTFYYVNTFVRII